MAKCVLGMGRKVDGGPLLLASLLYPDPLRLPVACCQPSGQERMGLSFLFHQISFV